MSELTDLYALVDLERRAWNAQARQIEARMKGNSLTAVQQDQARLAEAYHYRNMADQIMRTVSSMMRVMERTPSAQMESRVVAYMGGTLRRVRLDSEQWRTKAAETGYTPACSFHN